MLSMAGKKKAFLGRPFLVQVDPLLRFDAQ